MIPIPILHVCHSCGGPVDETQAYACAFARHDVHVLQPEGDLPETVTDFLAARHADTECVINREGTGCRDCGRPMTQFEGLIGRSL